MPTAEALEALTIRPARMLGVDEFVGSIEQGKDADLVIFTGEPLKIETWVDTTIIDGQVVYRRTKDRSSASCSGPAEASDDDEGRSRGRSRARGLG